jgi:uncharacterized RDD family membrane protein YckC
MFIHTILDVVLTAAVGTIPGAPPASSGGMFPHDATHGWFAFLPWGFHDPSLALVGQAIMAVVSGAFVLGYFTWTEARDGASLGKRALDLRVVRVDGQPLTQRDALLRNLAKISPPFLVFDGLLMLLAWPQEKRRASDRIAGTMVVRA